MKLRQVLINLLNNAIKFTSQGQVSLKVEAIAPELLEFTIADTGVGIEKPELTHIFQAFVQAASGRKTQEGTGLGLAISQEFVNLLGGEIKVSSEVGRGSEFKFTLPIKMVGKIGISGINIADIYREKSSQRIVGLAPEQPTYKVLVVDDQESNRQLLVQIFRPLGFILQQATNGQEAIDLWQSWQPDLICMDLRMLPMDGYGAIEEIRRQQSVDYPNSSPPIIIAFTASSSPKEREIALDRGFDDFITKPFQDTHVLETVARHLPLEYIYAPLDITGDENIFPEDETPEFTPPFTWTTKIKQAIRDQDWEAMELCILELCQEDLDFAYALQCHLDNSDYSGMMAVIDAKENK
jgi:CheY-like chemotaxis protein/anti-sigma regulatory factor (Ser/Thr protein kinase)